ncbi:glycosyltransferase [Salipaludibacillus agaradhaerens]|uniref:glycosyltransferase family 2 protein n=1 Tax=Salipaludibacillus agaradhaerens TaxID=76935 RepID=UPI0021517713|nr:glycosyltransferase [Salipaludibacillus agaradhaerens]MCR6106816.1 glycosyltransferase [Salipaludibacillus agaradhaerens]MCR6118848.1 glycosyltransferase [Salipaludibacillus agaradhaerens]UJW57923.1 glycosyltransferase [Bacillus sp. A116_S68]
MIPKISIIVAVYNLSDYLPTCIDSILNQSFKEFELLLIDDGSTDDSIDICKKYEQVDNRVRLIQKANGGIASVRNCGIREAKGKYIGFVDGDDFIHRDMYHSLLKVIEATSSDIAVCDFAEVYPDDPVPQLNDSGSIANTVVYSSMQALKQLYTKDALTFIYPWNKLYRKSLFTELKYVEGKNYDDEFIAHKLLYRCKTIAHVNKVGYYYLQRQGSWVRSPFTVKKFDRVYALNDRRVFFKEKQLKDLHALSVHQFMEVFLWYYHHATDTLTDIDDELATLKASFNDAFFDLLRHKNIRLKQKIMLIIFRFNPRRFQKLKAKKEAQASKSASL